MNQLSRIVASSLACTVAFAQAAFAGGAYSVDPVVKDSGSDAGVYLLVAVAALIVIKSIASPKSAEPSMDAPDTTE